MGYYKIYPNMFVVLVGPSGKCRKTVSINTAISLLKGLPDVIISADSITREALIGELEKSTRIGQIGTGPYPHASVTIISKELSVFLGQNNQPLLSLLTDLYDCPNDWVYKTKNKGTNTINNIWLNMLAASTPTWLVGSIPLDQIGGGFTSRIIFVVESECRLRNPLPRLTRKELQLQEELILQLEKISMLSGECSLTPDGEEFFSRWYMEENVKLEDERFKGYAERKHVHLLKVATVLSACDRLPGQVNSSHIADALKLINDIEGNMIKAFGATGRSTIAVDVDEVLNIICDSGQIDRSQLMHETKMNIHPTEFENIIKMLKEARDIEEVLRDGKIMYKPITEVN